VPACLLVLLLAGTAGAQFGRPGAPGDPAPPPAFPPGGNGFSEAVALPTNPDLRKKLEAVQDYLQAESWEPAIRVLQGLLDKEEDVFVPVVGKDGTRWGGLRAEIARLVGSMPPRGREFYEQMSGQQGKALLAEARKTNDLPLLAAVAQRCPYTAAGNQALELLAAYHLDRAQPLLAALAYEQLLDRAGDAPAPATLFRAALAFRGAGDAGRAEKAWRRLAEQKPDGVRLGDRLLDLDALREVYEKAGPAPDRRDAGRGSRAPLPDAAWREATPAEPVTRSWLDTAVRNLEGRGLLLPALFPVAADGRVVYRTPWGVRAVDGGTGKLAWESDLYGSLDTLTAAPELVYARDWVGGYVSGQPQVLFENSVLGTLGSDGTKVYAVEDLAVPPYFPTGPAGGGPELTPNLTHAPRLTARVYHSRLVAFDLRTGRVVWEAGDRAEPGKETSPLQNAYFLGPPLALGGRLYALVEFHEQVRLTCLTDGGGVVWAQTLAIPANPMLRDGGRRLHAAVPAYADGVLVCPTNTGAVVAVDLLTHSPLWAHAYREKAAGPRLRGLRPAQDLPPMPHLTPGWQVSAPVVAEGKVVFTAPDGQDVRCLDLRDGTLLWQANRQENDLYLAGILGGRVLLVGKGYCRALALADGREAWRTTTGVPSGRGAAAGGAYYLPLKESAAKKGPAVLAVDADGGVREVPLGEKDVPGNLVFHDGLMLSQTVGGLAAYPQQAQDK
jgi:outer membrane protein assembly factor BamB